MWMSKNAAVNIFVDPLVEAVRFFVVRSNLPLP